MSAIINKRLCRHSFYKAPLIPAGFAQCAFEINKNPSIGGGGVYHNSHMLIFIARFVCQMALHKGPQGRWENDMLNADLMEWCTIPYATCSCHGLKVMHLKFGDDGEDPELRYRDTQCMQEVPASTTSLWGSSTVWNSCRQSRQYWPRWTSDLNQ